MRYVPNPAAPAGRKPVELLTDRALRYRANAPERRPEDPKLCCFCGGQRNIGVHHVNGREEDLEPENLCWACKSCNAQVAAAMQQAGIGRRVRQFNPAAGARNLAQWVQAVLSVKGASNDMSVADAVAMIRATSRSMRSSFAREIWRRRRSHGTADKVPF